MTDFLRLPFGKRIEHYFPLEVQVTQEIIDKSDVLNPFRCIGVNSLEKALREKGIKGHLQIIWDKFEGNVYQRNKLYRIKSSEKMIEITSPKKVLFTFL